MFEYAISRNQRHRPTRRVLMAFVASLSIHVAMLITILEFPQLLEGGMLHRFRVIALITDSLTARKDAEEAKEWRTVAVLEPQGRMQAPSAEQLKELLYDWSRKNPVQTMPPVRIRWGEDEKTAAKKDAPPPPRITADAKPAPESEPPKPAGAGAGDAQASAGGSAPPAVRAEPAGGRRDTVNLPPPSPPARTDTAAAAPRSIPEGVKTPPAPAPDYRVFDSEQKAIASDGSGFFGTEGFPLGEYANIIKERIKGKWNIPSHLQSFQGHTTVVFYIDRNGRYGNAKIVRSSGSNSFDIAALMAVIESDPFPPLPKGFPGKHIGAKFVLSWNEP